MPRLFFTLVLAVSISDLSGQSQFFLRPLDPGRTSLALDVIPSDRDEYLFSNLLPVLGQIPGGNLNLTRLKPAGEILWSKDFTYPNQVIGGMLTPWASQGAYLISGLSHEADTAAVAFLTKIQNFSGQPIWSKKISLEDAFDLANLGKAESMLRPDQKIVLGAGASLYNTAFNANDLCLAELDTAGVFSWGNKYCFSCIGPYDLTMGNVIPTSDGGFLFSGGIQFLDLTVFSRDIFLMKTDSLGAVEWSKGYDLVDTVNFFLDWGTHAVELANGHFAVVGESQNLLGGPRQGLIMEVDSSGLFLQAKRVTIPLNLPNVYLKNLAAPDSNLLVIQGTSLSQFINPPLTEQNFLFQISLENGALDWQTNFFTESHFNNITLSDGFSVLPGGYAILANYISPPDEFFPNLVVADLNGRTGCQTPIGLFVENDLLMEVTDYAPEVLPLSEVLDFPVTEEDFEDYTIDVPVLDLGPSEFFCEPTVKTIDATVPGAESYSWSNGFDTPMIVAEVPGTYSVEDTSNVQCWILRDTISFQILPPPFVNIAVDTTGFCELGELTLIAGAVGAETLSWSTGSTENFIVVSTPGAYSVTGVNMCGSTTAGITLTLPDCSGEPEVCMLEFPNVFTPDGDGSNDRFKPLSNCTIYGEYRFRIYSRWGQLVYESTDPTNGWDGNFKEKPMPSDLFAWILEYRFPKEDEVKLEKGEVTLLR
ncbi:MAG: gliding motility-associated C-terminal domain-containing protein [Saprospirales bacterium]|nr:gliding motility-associated C-terminal domain-containing protein [Saprospirales bacterium]